MLSMKTMAGRSKLTINGRVIDLNSISDSIDFVFSYIMEALTEDPKSWQIFLATLERIIEGEGTPETETILGDKDQDSYTTKQPLTHSVSKLLTSRKSQASNLFLLLKYIISKHCNSSDINAAELLFSYILEALMDTPKGKDCILSCLQRLDQPMYLNPKGVSNPESDTTKGSCENPQTQAASTPLTRNKFKVMKINGNIQGINLCELVTQRRLEAIRKKPLGEELLLFKLQRIILEAKKEYMKIKAINTPKIDEFVEDNNQDYNTQSSNRSKRNKSEACFENVCELFVPEYKLPEELLLAQSMYCAKTGLASYNKKKGTEYKLVEPLSSARHMYCEEIIFHCNFTASKVLKNSSHTSQPKLFYADFRFH